MRESSSSVRAPDRRTRVLRRAALFVGLAFGLSSCVYLPAAVEHQSSSPDTRPWWCHSTGDGGHGHDGHNAYEGVTKGMLSWEDCFVVSAHFDLAVAYVNQWPTEGEAEDDGWHQVVGYATGMGTHHADLSGLPDGWLTSPEFDPDDPSFPGTRLDEAFDPTQPEFLMYDGNGRSARLTGMAWWVKTTDGHPPPGFEGDNDWWHQHPLVCLNTTAFTYMGENRTDAQCASLGGVNVDFSDWWMVHAWIVEPWLVQYDVFTNHHPCLSSSGPITDTSDPCWTEAMHGPDGGH